MGERDQRKWVSYSRAEPCRLRPQKAESGRQNNKVIVFAAALVVLEYNRTSIFGSTESKLSCASIPSRTFQNDVSIAVLRNAVAYEATWSKRELAM